MVIIKFHIFMIALCSNIDSLGMVLIVVIFLSVALPCKINLVVISFSDYFTFSDH